MMKLLQDYSFFKRESKNQGMTILEVIVVVAIIGILAAIAAPGWVTFANRQRANRAADQILQSIRTSQSEAKRTRRTRTLEFGVDAATNTPLIDTDGITTKVGEGDLDGMVVLKALESVSGGNGNFTGTAIQEPIQFTSTGGIDNVDLPVHVTVAIPDADGLKKCVIVRSLLGATQTGKDAECAF